MGPTVSADLEVILPVLRKWGPQTVREIADQTRLDVGRVRRALVQAEWARSVERAGVAWGGDQCWQVPGPGGTDG